jgi:hypothetical protein
MSAERFDRIECLLFNDDRFYPRDICSSIDRCNRPSQRFSPFLKCCLNHSIEFSKCILNINFGFNKLNDHLIENRE